jgi:hypothetical protein
MGVLLPDRLYCTRVNARGRAMRTWIDRTNDGLSGMPADGISLPPKKGTSARPAGAARRLGYINGATGRKGLTACWHGTANRTRPLSRQVLG